MLQSISDPNIVNLNSDQLEQQRNQASASQLRKLLVIAGLPIDNLTMEETLDRIEHFIEVGRQTGKTHQVATVNADFVVKSTSDPELGYLIQSCDLATADGMPLVWGARKLGVDIKERVAGSDMVPLLAERAAQKGYSIYLYGASEGVAEKAGKILTENNPGLKIVGAVSPPFTPVIDVDKNLLDNIRNAKPDILLVALGNPKQEKFIGMYGPDLGVPVAIGIGGTLDFISGKTVRAPRWMQRAGIEWFHRMLSDPKRLVKRYVHDLFGFSSFFFGQWRRLKTAQSEEVLLPESELILLNGKAILKLSGRLDVNNAEHLYTKFDAILSETYDVEVDLQDVSFIDSVSIGVLLAYAKQCRENGGNLKLINTPSNVYNSFKYLKMDRFFDIYQAGKSTSEPEPYQTKRAQDLLIISMPKRIDTVTSKETLQHCIEAAQNCANIILDFSNTRLVASAGLALLVHLNEHLKERNGSLALANCSDEISRTLELVKFDLLFPILEKLPQDK
ncbi:MAG: WecB/TagA/CpsF family glycosyltransferase [Chloroflexota bacterium]